MAYKVGLTFNANLSPVGRGVDMPYKIIDIFRTYNHKDELIKTVYSCEVDLGEGLKGRTEYTEDQIKAFKDNTETN